MQFTNKTKNHIQKKKLRNNRISQDEFGLCVVRRGV